MRKYGYQRPSATLRVTRKRPVRRKKPSFFFKFIFLLFLICGVGFGVVFGVRYALRVVKEAQITDWHVKSVSITGLSGLREKEIFTRVSSLEGKAFSHLDAQALQKELKGKYPMLSKLSVSRGLVSGALKISAQPRVPVAQFLLSDSSHKYVDQDSIIYEDPQEVRDVLHVKLVGNTPSQLDPSFVDLVQSLIKLKKTLPFESLEFNVNTNAVTLGLPDQSVIYFGEPKHLKQKVRRASQIMMFARGKYEMPVSLNFAFFDEGKVFLTQNAH